MTFGNQRRRTCVARQPREGRRSRPVDPHRHDHGAGLVGDQAGAVVDLHQAAGDGDAAFGEDDQRLAALDGVDQRARRHRLGRIERHGAGELQERLHPPALGDAVVDGEDRLLVEQRQRERGVEEAHVVERDDRVRRRPWRRSRAPHLEPVEGAEEDREEIAERARRQGPEDDRGRRRRWRRRAPATRVGSVDAELLQRRRRRARRPTMKAALSTLTAAMTRARRSAPAQACTAAKDGTMNRPPAIARPAKSIAMRKPSDQAKKARAPTGGIDGAARVDRVGEVEREGAHEERADRRRQAARCGRARARRRGPSRRAMPTEKTASSTVTTSSVPPSRFLTSGGRSDSTTAPTSQNQRHDDAAAPQPRVGPEVAAAARRSSAGCWGRREDRAPPRRCAG